MEKLLHMIKLTGVLKYWQDRTIAGFVTATGSVSTAQTATAAIYGYNTTRFTADPSSGGNVTIVGGSSNLSISTNIYRSIHLNK